MPRVKPPIEDPAVEVRAKRNQLEVKSARPKTNEEMDPKELKEREEAAQAYAGEDEAHFVRFLDDCVKMSTDSMRPIREQQQECWDIYNEKEPPHYTLKESWQSRVVVPKPYSSVQFFLAIVRKAFDPKFLSIENEQDKETADFIRKLMELMLSRSYSNFPIQFTDATGMGAAVGQSMEMIPQWIPGKGLQYILVPPWHIQRDPDALSRSPQTGMYWIHQEWMDYYDLKEMEKNGQMLNVPQCGPGGTWGSEKDNPDLSPEEIKRRQDMLWQQSEFRTKVLTSEFWGTILAKNGEMLLPSAAYTVVGTNVVRLPKASPYTSLRWPGVGFSPLPHLLRFDGRSLLQGVKSLWYMMCSLLSLHVDNLNWIVNPPTEIDISSLMDQDDLDDYPGHQWLTQGTAQGQQVVRAVDRKSNTGDVLANMNKGDMMFQEGVMINYAAQGLPGYRAEVTATESSQNLEQSMTVVGLMGENLEDGALNAIVAGYETVAINITYKELAMMMGEEVANKYRDNSSPTGLRMPHLTSGSFKVSGVATLMRNQEIINAISKLILPLFEMGNTFLPYIKPYSLLKSLERRLNLEDEKLLIDADRAKTIDDAQQTQQEAQVGHQAGTEAATAEGAQAKAAKDAALAEKAKGEGLANEEQAGLFKAQAGAVATAPAPGETVQ